MARLTYANVVSTLALFAALGGGAYAAINLPKNSVTTVQVKNGSLLAKDFKKGQLKAGARGLAGPAGLQGAKGAAGVQGIPGVKGDPGLDGSAKAYAYIGGPGTVGPDAHGITSANVTANLSNQFTDQISEYCIHGLPFTPTVAIVQPDVLSGGAVPIAEVQTPSENTGSCGGAQVYIRLAELGIGGANFGSAYLTTTGYHQASAHGFYIEIN